jgi:hypothetical protein
MEEATPAAERYCVWPPHATANGVKAMDEGTPGAGQPGQGWLFTSGPIVGELPAVGILTQVPYFSWLVRL